MQILQRTFNLVAIHELKRNVGVTLKLRYSYMKENKVMDGLLVSVDEKCKIFRYLCL